MGLLRAISLRAVAVLCALGACAAVPAAEWDLSLDLRAVSSDGRESFLDNGQGKFRFDADHQGLRLGRLRAAVTQPLGEVFSAYAEATSWGDTDKNPVDLTEIYLEYRPYPRDGFRSRARLGAFYPPMSLENRASGWETPYTITPSAISSWIGEEIRTIGLEGQVDWLGSRTGHVLDLQFTAALFGWNDPAGTMIAAHGFGFSDRQTTLFGRVGAPANIEDSKKELFHEIDGRPGFYVGAQARYLDRVVLNVLHYDNRADPMAYAPSIRDFAWETKFDAAALRVETGNGWTAIAQWLDGNTYIAPGGFLLDWAFDSRSALLAKRVGSHMLAVRYDDFAVKFTPADGESNEKGHAASVAYSFDQGRHWRFTLEWLRVRSNVEARLAKLGELPLATETKVELAVRYALSGG